MDKLLSKKNYQNAQLLEQIDLLKSQQCHLFEELDKTLASVSVIQSENSCIESDEDELVEGVLAGLPQKIKNQMLKVKTENA